MPEPVRIVIVIEGGCVQAVLTDMARPGAVEAVIVDLDTEGGDPEDFREFAFDFGEGREEQIVGYIHDNDIETNAAYVTEAFKAARS